MYRVGSFIDFDTDYGTPSMFEYFQTEEGQSNKPDTDAGVSCHYLLLQLFSKVSHYIRSLIVRELNITHCLICTSIYSSTSPPVSTVRSD